MRRTALLVLAILTLAGSALAARQPTSSENAAIRLAVRGFISMPNSPSAKDNRVTVVSVSTLDPRYAAANLSSKSAGPSQMVLHRSGSIWWVVGFGSSMGCDSAPKIVLADLKVGCSPPPGVAWISDCGSLRSKPASLTLACGDGDYLARRPELEGLGQGRGDRDRQRPRERLHPELRRRALPLVQGDRDRRPALDLREGAAYYARITITYPGTRPPGLAKRDVHTLTC